MDYTIRKMEIKDVDQVHAFGIHQTEFSTESGSFWTKEQLINWLQSENDITIVAERGGKIIGFSLYAQHIPTKKMTWENLYVDPVARGSGVGSVLIKEGLKLAKGLGCVYMMGCINAVDREQFADYLTKFGYKKYGEVLWMDLVL